MSITRFKIKIIITKEVHQYEIVQKFWSASFKLYFMNINIVMGPEEKLATLSSLTARDVCIKRRCFMLIQSTEKPVHKFTCASG